MMNNWNLEINLIMLIVLYVFFKNVYSVYNASYIANSKANITYNFSCITQSNNMFKLKYYTKRLYTKVLLSQLSLRKISFNATRPIPLIELYKLFPEMKSKIKVYIFKKVIISDTGSVHTQSYNLRLGKECKCNKIISKIPSRIKKYNNVLVISQYYNYATFHSLIECLTKLSYFLSEIKSQKKHIHIHIGNNEALKKYITYLGIDLSLFVVGFIKTKKAYIVENSKCGKPSGIIPLLLMQNELIKRNIYFNEPQNYIIIIKRLYIRRISNHNELVSLLKRIFISYYIREFLPNTSFNDTLLYFGRAKYIFAPHGAGLSNIILCHKNTIIIEFITYIYTNLCYAALSLSLGYRYYGIYQNYYGYNFYINISFLKEIVVNSILKQKIKL